MGNHLLQIIGFLAAAVFFVSLSVRFRLGPVVGYFVAGLTLGPWGFGMVKDVDGLMSISEFGVVFLLFVLGLELDPKKLWELRTPIFGMGSGQILGTAAVFTGLGLAFGVDWKVAVVGAFAFALSSTAIAVQILRDKNLFNTVGGRSAFSVLLFQDIAVIPLLLALNALGGVEAAEGAHLGAWSTLGLVVLTAVVGHFVFRPAFRFAASLRSKEVFTALALLVVLGLAALMHELEISMTLGAFLGGVLLANSEFRHAIETDIEPFRGLFLGLFFMSVGMTIDLPVIAQQPLTVFGGVVAILGVKVLVHLGLARVFRLNRVERPMFSIMISQVGEFAFVIFGIAQGLKLLSPGQATIMTAAAALTMLSTPFLVMAFDRWVAPLLCREPDQPFDEIYNDEPQVLIAGFGRVGQIVGRLLLANKIRATVLDHDTTQIEQLRKFGFKVYYGDATQINLLEAAGIANVKLVVVAVDDVDDNLQVVDQIRERYPDIRIIARARNVRHQYELMEREVDHVERETFESSLRMGTKALQLLGWDVYQSVRAANIFREHNYKAMTNGFMERGNESQLISAAKQARDDLHAMFERDQEFKQQQNHGWDSEARVGKEKETPEKAPL